MIKNFYKKIIFYILLVTCIFFLFINNIHAKILTIDEISDSFSNTLTFNALRYSGSDFSTSIDTDNKILHIYLKEDGDEEKEEVFSFKYADDYIEYDNRAAEVTQESADNEFIPVLMLNQMIETIFELCGYDNKTLSSEEKYTGLYDTYGIDLQTEHYKFNGTDEDDGTWELEGDFIKYFKLSFDSEKIDALVAKYGIDDSEQDPNKEIILGLTPTLEAKDITENSVTLYPHIPYVNTDPDYEVFCYIYRSTSEDGTYEKISNMAVSCLNGETGVTDKDLESNKTYYYKTIVVDGTKYSNPIKVDIKAKTTPKKDDGLVNPKTGFKFPIIAICSIIVVSTITLLIIRKKSVFKSL